jgi:hypothetical protein
MGEFTSTTCHCISCWCERCWGELFAPTKVPIDYKVYQKVGDVYTEVNKVLYEDADTNEVSCPECGKEWAEEEVTDY